MGAAAGVRLVPDVEQLDVSPVVLFDLDMLDADEAERSVLRAPVVFDRADFSSWCCFSVPARRRDAAEAPRFLPVPCGREYHRAFSR